MRSAEPAGNDGDVGSPMAPTDQIGHASVAQGWADAPGVVEGTRPSPVGSALRAEAESWFQAYGPKTTGTCVRCRAGELANPRVPLDWTRRTCRECFVADALKRIDRMRAEGEAIERAVREWHDHLDGCGYCSRWWDHGPRTVSRRLYLLTACHLRRRKVATS